MSNVIPEQALGPNNQNWRRWVEGRIIDLGKRLEQKYGNDITNGFNATASSMRLLQDQVRFLQSLRTTQISDLSTTSTTTPSTTITKSLSLPFNLTRDSIVSIQTVATISTAGNRSASGSVGGGGTSRPLVDGVVIPGATAISDVGSSIEIAATGVTNNGHSYSGVIYRNDSATFPAGSHTATCTWEAYFNGSIGSARIYDARIVVSVIG